MDMEKLRQQLIIDEGVKYSVYLDHLSLKSCGIGHYIRQDEPEFDLEVGTQITEDRCTELFEEDIKSVMKDCKKVFEDWDDMDEEVKQICANMMFNLGLPRFSKFRKTINNIINKNYAKAAEEMRDSRWYRQVTNRAERLAKRMEAIA
jgi:lysozyme